MNKIDFVKQKIPFTQVANAVLCDPTITAKAKGLYAYLYSKPDGWDFSVHRMIKELKESKNTVNETLKELESAGLLRRERQSDGRMKYLVFFPPVSPIPEIGTGASSQKSHSAKIGTISNKDSYISNKDFAANAENNEDEELSIEPDEDYVPTKTLAKRENTKRAGYDTSDTRKVLDWAEDRNEQRFVNRPKQLKFIASMLEAKYSVDAIKSKWLEMESDSFWGGKGFDFAILSNEISKVKKVKEGTYVV